MRHIVEYRTGRNQGHEYAPTREEAERRLLARYPGATVNEYGQAVDAEGYVLGYLGARPSNSGKHREGRASIRIRCEPEQRNQIFQAARSAGLSVTDWALRRLLG